MTNRYRYGIVTKEDGTFGLDFHADVDPAVDADAQRQLADLVGPSSLTDPAAGGRVTDEVGREWSASPDARAFFGDGSPSRDEDQDQLRLRTDVLPPSNGIRHIALTAAQKAAAEAARAGEE